MGHYLTKRCTGKGYCIFSGQSVKNGQL